jgi:hypothetical protein
VQSVDPNDTYPGVPLAVEKETEVIVHIPALAGVDTAVPVEYLEEADKEVGEEDTKEGACTLLTEGG